MELNPSGNVEETEFNDDEEVASSSNADAEERPSENQQSSSDEGKTKIVDPYGLLKSEHIAAAALDSAAISQKEKGRKRKYHTGDERPEDNRRSAAASHQGEKHLMESMQQEIRRLQEENILLRQENEVLRRNSTLPLSLRVSAPTSLTSKNSLPIAHTGGPDSLAQFNLQTLSSAVPLQASLNRTETCNDSFSHTRNRINTLQEASTFPRLRATATASIPPSPLEYLSSLQNPRGPDLVSQELHTRRHWLNDLLNLQRLRQSQSLPSIRSTGSAIPIQEAPRYPQHLPPFSSTQRDSPEENAEDKDT